MAAAVLIIPHLQWLAPILLRTDVEEFITKGSE